MKPAILLMMIMLIFPAPPAGAFGILLMDSLEFKTLQHNAGKRSYVIQMTEKLKADPVR